MRTIRVGPIRYNVWLSYRLIVVVFQYIAAKFTAAAFFYICKLYFHQIGISLHLDAIGAIGWNGGFYTIRAR